MSNRLERRHETEARKGELSTRGKGHFERKTLKDKLRPCTALIELSLTSSYLTYPQKKREERSNYHSSGSCFSSPLFVFGKGAASTLTGPVL